VVLSFTGVGRHPGATTAGSRSPVILHALGRYRACKPVPLSSSSCGLITHRDQPGNRLVGGMRLNSQCPPTRLTIKSHPEELQPAASVAPGNQNAMKYGYTCTAHPVSDWCRFNHCSAGAEQSRRADYRSRSGCMHGNRGLLGMTTFIQNIRRAAAWPGRTIGWRA
jgi:hypothetical protein